MVNDWDGLPIEFGAKAQYVCKRGYKFEDDPAQEHVEYTCQGEKNDKKKLRKGFFDTPLKKEDWPRCLEGIVF